MLKAISYEDMGVVKEITEGSHLVRSCDVTGLWPKKFAPAIMTVDELHSTAAKERELHSHLHTGLGEVDVQESVWQQTLKEVDNGAVLLGPINLEDVDATFPFTVAGDLECSKDRKSDLLTTSRAPLPLCACPSCLDPFERTMEIQEFAVAWTNYFDDFVTFAKADEVASVTGRIKFVFKALGWLFPEDGDKAPDFSHNVSALGVQINVENMHCGVFTIDNTAGRKSDLLQLLDDIITSKKLNRIDAMRLRGRLQFAGGQFAGRIARKSLNVITKHA